MFAVCKFNIYLDGTKFVVQTDHSALSWLMQLHEPAGRLARWALLMQHCDFAVQYRKGSTNMVADALSCAFACILGTPFCEGERVAKAANTLADSVVEPKPSESQGGADFAAQSLASCVAVLKHYTTDGGTECQKPTESNANNSMSVLSRGPDIGGATQVSQASWACIALVSVQWCHRCCIISRSTDF